MIPALAALCLLFVTFIVLVMRDIARIKRNDDDWLAPESELSPELKALLYPEETFGE